MALRVWLPLDGNLNNYGISGATVSATPTASFNSSGKIGQCLLHTGNIYIPAAQISSIFNNQTMSISFWYNNNGGSTNSHAISGFCGNTQGDTDAVRIYDFFQYPTKNDFHWSMGTLGSGVLSGVIPDNIWTHFSIIYNKGTLLIYINGELKHESAGHSSNYTFNKSYYISFGYNQKLNDFRIYDHCLSPKEVKEISKGLVSHYQLKSGGTGSNPNLVPGTKNTLQTAAIGQYYTQLHESAYFWNLSAGDTVTYRVYLVAPSTKKVRARIQFYNSDNDRPNIYGNYINASSQGYSEITLTLSAAQRAYAKMQLLVDCNDGTTNTENFSWKEVKLEKNNMATSWVPNETDPLYNSLGYNVAREEDVSGYQHNGAITGTIGTDSDSPRYTVASKFTTAGTINAPRGMITVGNAPFTVNFWLKMNSSTQTLNADIIEFGGNQPLRFANTNTAGTSVAWCNYPLGGTGTIGQCNPTVGKWRMMTLTCDGTKYTAYMDAAKLQDVTIGGTIWTPNGKVTIGDTTGSLFCMSDLRIYSTCLSINDLKELFTVGATIDNAGNAYAYEFQED